VSDGTTSENGKQRIPSARTGVPGHSRTVPVASTRTAVIKRTDRCLFLSLSFAVGIFISLCDDDGDDDDDDDDDDDEANDDDDDDDDDDGG